MTVCPIETIDDPAIAIFRNLKDRELAARHGRFIAESEFVVRRLLASTFPVDRVLLTDRRVAEIAPLVPPGVPVFSAPAQLVNQIVGYRFHSGVIASGIRVPGPTLDAVVPATGRVRLVVCPEISNNENLGGLIRVAAAFGATGLVLGERSCDPFFRQSIRVSMGTIFSVPVVQSSDIGADLRRMGGMNVERVAAVLDESAEVLSTFRPSPRTAVLFGNEAQGLAPEHVALCDRTLTVPMKLGTDSLNVAVSAGIILHHLA